MYLYILILIIFTSFTIRSIFKTIAVIKGVFRHEKDSLNNVMSVTDLLKR